MEEFKKLAIEDSIFDYNLNTIVDSKSENICPQQFTKFEKSFDKEEESNDIEA